MTGASEKEAADITSNNAHPEHGPRSKKTLRFIALAAFGVAAAAAVLQNDDADIEGFNPVKEKFVESGLLEAAQADSDLVEMCDYMAGANNASIEQTGQPLITKNHWDFASFVYECHAIGHQGFASAVFNEHLRTPPQRGGEDISMDETKNFIRDMVEAGVSDTCRPLPEAAKQEPGYDAHVRLCSAYGYDIT